MRLPFFFYTSKYLFRINSNERTNDKKNLIQFCYNNSFLFDPFSTISDGSKHLIFLFCFQEIAIGMATGIRALSLTHTGELEWEMYIPNEVNDTFMRFQRMTVVF